MVSIRLNGEGAATIAATPSVFLALSARAVRLIRARVRAQPCASDVGRCCRYWAPPPPPPPPSPAPSENLIFFSAVFTTASKWLVSSPTVTVGLHCWSQL